jgi:hypothetical protein
MNSYAHAQSSSVDSVFLKDKEVLVSTKTRIDYEKQTVSVAALHQKEQQEIRFEQVSGIKLSKGKSYVQRTDKEQLSLLVILVQGTFSLLYNEHTDVFYAERNDSLRIISKDYVSLALPVIFGKDVLDGFNQQFHLKPDHSEKYLKKLTLYANQGDIPSPESNQQSINVFKRTVYIGPYSGLGVSRSAFELSGFVGGTKAFMKTPYYKARPVPVGIQFAISMAPRLNIELSSYFNHTYLNDFKSDSIGNFKLYGIPSYALAQKFENSIKMSGFRFKTFNFDLSLKYYLTKVRMARLRPFVFAGPSIVVMTRTEMKLSVKFNNDANTASYDHRCYKSHTKDLMVALNCGAGIDYQISRRFSTSLSGKYQGGIYPKTLFTMDLQREENNTPVENITMIEVMSKFQDRYDQYSRLLYLNGSIMFKL